MKTAKAKFHSSPLATVGESLHADQARAKVRSLSAHDQSVLVVGPSGSGKESLARGIHAASPRSGRPFVTLNCKLLAAGGFFDSQVFGHLPGAFAGLTNSSLGLIRAAHGGTLFLREVESLELESQWKLLRTLQDQAVIPLGGSEAIPVDIRVIASTCIDLPLGVSVGMFRGDLFELLSSNLVELSRLADHTQDIPALAAEICREIAAKRRRQEKRLGECALAWMLRHEWPGNFNELRQVIDLASSVESDVIDARAIRGAMKKLHSRTTTFQRRTTATRFTGFAAMRATLTTRCRVH